MEDMSINEIPENENAKKVLNIVEKIFNFDDKQKFKGIKISLSKQMLQTLPTAFAQVKAVNTTENLLNEVREIICPLYWEKVAELPDRSYFVSDI